MGPVVVLQLLSVLTGIYLGVKFGCAILRSRGPYPADDDRDDAWVGGGIVAIVISGCLFFVIEKINAMAAMWCNYSPVE